MDLHRHVRIVVRLNSEEKRKFERLAKANYTNVSEFIREVLHIIADATANSEINAGSVRQLLRSIAEASTKLATEAATTKGQAG